MKALRFAALVAASSFAALAAAQGGPTDPQIASIAVTANQVDVDAGKLAESKSKNKDVKQFAKNMVTDHSAVIKQAVALVTKLKVRPEDNATSKALKQGGKENVAKLKKLRGKAFDQAYAEHEVAYHQQVIDAVKNVLIPNAKNAELKALLEKVEPVLEQHLEHAKMLAASLGK